MYAIGILLKTANPRFLASVMREHGASEIDIQIVDAATGRDLTGPLGHSYPGIIAAMVRVAKWDPVDEVTIDPVLLTRPEPTT